MPMEDLLERGNVAMQEGNMNKAREAWRAAAQVYPGAKQPWLRLAENYFNAADYGNATLAAQEALQRDPRDRLANSVVAVSGLRLASGALANLRDESSYAVGSREEAIMLTRTMREALGEPVLVPQNDAKKIVRRPLRAPQANQDAMVKPIARPAVPATPIAPSAGNPLDKLK